MLITCLRAVTTIIGKYNAGSRIYSGSKPMPAKTIEEFWQLCRTDQQTALIEARSRSCAWFRCQDLAKVAWFAGSQQAFELLVDEALREALEESSPNRIVTVAAWPVRAMAERSDPRLEQAIEQLIEIIEPEPNPVRRSDALLMLLESVFKQKGLRPLVLEPLMSACKQVNHWKTQRALRRAAQIVALDDQCTAQWIIEAIEEPRIKRQAARYIAERKMLGPHEFMPHYQMLDGGSR